MTETDLVSLDEMDASLGPDDLEKDRKPKRGFLERLNEGRTRSYTRKPALPSSRKSTYLMPLYRLYCEFHDTL